MNTLIYGIIKIKKDRGPVAKAGFKYIKFEPQIQLIGNRLIYKDRSYTIDDDKIYVKFSHNDITSESMTSVTISNCEFMTSFVDYDVHTIVFDSKLFMYPKITEKIENCQDFVIKFSPYDFIILNINPFGKGSVITKKSDNIKESNEEVIEMIKEAYSNEFETSFRLRLPLMTSSDQNRKFFQRFKTKYGSIMTEKYKFNIENYDILDVIELSSIEIIKYMTDRKFGHLPDMDRELKKYPVFEIKPFDIKLVANGIDSVNFKSTDDNTKFYYLLIDDCCYHSLLIDGNSKCLLVQRFQINLNRSKPKEMVFVKFNKNTAKKYKTSGLIHQLKQ